MPKRFLIASCFVFLFCSLTLYSQTAAHEPGQETVTGTVVSSSLRTVVIKTEGDRYQLFISDRDTARPRTIPVGSTVRITYLPTDQEGVRLARRITVVSAAPQPAPAAARQGSPQTQEDALPPSVRRLERELERGFRKYGVGLRAGPTLDPELITTGIHANLGTLFDRNFSLRPNFEFAFGEVSKLFGLNFEGLYRLPFSARDKRWTTYVGGGPGFFFIDRNFERAARGDRNIDFDEFDFNAGLNILTGVQFRSGMFLEAKTTVYASPHLRVIVGYNF